MPEPERYPRPCWRRSSASATGCRVRSLLTRSGSTSWSSSANSMCGCRANFSTDCFSSPGAGRRCAVRSGRRGAPCRRRSPSGSPPAPLGHAGTRHDEDATRRERLCRRLLPRLRESATAGHRRSHDRAATRSGQKASCCRSQSMWKISACGVPVELWAWDPGRELQTVVTFRLDARATMRPAHRLRHQRGDILLLR